MFSTKTDTIAMLNAEGERVYRLREKYLALPAAGDEDDPEQYDAATAAWREIDAAHDAWDQAATDLAASVKHYGVKLSDLNDHTRDALVEPQR